MKSLPRIVKSALCSAWGPEIGWRRFYVGGASQKVNWLGTRSMEGVHVGGRQRPGQGKLLISKIKELALGLSASIDDALFSTWAFCGLEQIYPCCAIERSHR